MKRFALYSICLLLCNAFTFKTIAQLPEGFAQVRVAEKLDPTAMTIAPDGRIFITEKNGKVRIVKNGQLLPDPFVTIPVDNFNERGLGGIVLDPDFDRNHQFYLFYTVPAVNHNRVSRFTANGDYAIPGSEQIILDLEPLAGTIHNGGAMQFGPDGKLYISVGDGANGATAQNLNSLSGKILRINSDGSIPQDNPFYNQTTGKYRSIWALGFRNSFTFAFQPGTGRLFANDVGGERFEEVNQIVKGGNYGWDKIEGFRAGQLPPDNYREPVYSYGHNEGCSIIGAAFYNPQIATFPPQYIGKYFFTDYCQGYMKVLNPETGKVESTFLRGLNQPVQILVSNDGDLYYLIRSGIGGGSMQDNTSTNNGSLWRVLYEGSGAPFIALQPQSVTVPVGEDATFRVQASGKPPLIYKWYVNEILVANLNDPTFVFKNVTLTDNGKKIKSIVTNAQGEVISTEAILFVTSNTRPTAVITQPATNATYRAGETVNFAGNATDTEDGALNAEKLSWRIDFHHDEHIHPALDPTDGIASGSFRVPQIGEIDDNVFYRIYLTATDKGGLSKTTFRDIVPIKTQFTVATEPAGLPINIDGKTVAAPFTVTSVEGIRRTISAPATQIINNKLYFFDQWHNGSKEDFFTFLAGEMTNITARYTVANLAIGDGTGLNGNYYQYAANTKPDSAFNSVPKLTRLDSVINFDWGQNSPDVKLTNDNFTVRWTGKVLAPLSGTFTFYTLTDDGVRLFVNDQLLINQWIPQAATEYKAIITLEAGKQYPVRMEFYEAGGEAVARLQWSSDKLPIQVIPTTQLFPDRLPKIPAGEVYDIRVFPNPATSSIYLDIDTKLSDRVTWRVYDALGREMSQGQETVTQGANRFEINLTNLATGVYTVKVTGKKSINGHREFVKY